MTAPLRICSILRADPLRWHLLGVVAGLNLPDCWIGAGFVRNAVWDHLHKRPVALLNADVDVIWYDRQCAEPAEDRRLESRLLAIEPSISWSVKNQARMHSRNGDTSYASATDAMRYWPETATAVAAQRYGVDGCNIAAPLGLEDLLNLVLRPTASFRVEKRTIYEDRIRIKEWTRCWPLLTKVDE